MAKAKAGTLSGRKEKDAESYQYNSLPKAINQKGQQDTENYFSFAPLAPDSKLAKCNTFDFKTVAKPMGKMVEVRERSLVGRADFKVNICKNTYEDILFYEKKALNLDRMAEYLSRNTFSIDMQMNLSEFLFKVMPANIYDKDLENMMTD